MVGMFLTLKQVTETGYVAQATQTPADEAAHSAFLDAKGVPHLIMPLDEQSGWIERLEGGGWAIWPRGELPGAFDKTSVAPGEKVTFPALPDKSKIIIQGPVSATTGWDAEGAPTIDASFGLTLPGSYRIIVEAFPYKRKLFDLSVALPADETAGIETAEEIIGPDAEQIRALAKYSTMIFYANAARRDQVPDVVRAMYVRKAEEARRVVNGGTSDLIAQEVADRNAKDPTLNLTVEAWANVILEMAKESDQIEKLRMRANIEIDAAPSDALAILRVLAALKIALVTSPASTDGTWAPM
ncbi:hypothetical protein J2X36_000832 [Methylobacterium sp. BE186]|uniref:hypothetical protein n=1 Tax=Methylobacterium sp. BE186 TaxID=2817715 RepID=UPI0028679184|nr:hypothetical protein [Methylobacterium sp. BE186]MDR7036096.1 hypothetical protein [Methylobacterium sp. BE186]